MKITRVSRLSGKAHTLDLPVTQEEMDAFDRGVMVQDAFPTLSRSDREFILTGITSEEWDKAFPPEEEEEEGDREKGKDL